MTEAIKNCLYGAAIVAMVVAAWAVAIWAVWNHGPIVLAVMFLCGLYVLGREYRGK